MDDKFYWERSGEDEKGLWDREYFPEGLKSLCEMYRCCRGLCTGSEK